MCINASDTHGMIYNIFLTQNTRESRSDVFFLWKRLTLTRVLHEFGEIWIDFGESTLDLDEIGLDLTRNGLIDAKSTV